MKSLLVKLLSQNKRVFLYVVILDLLVLILHLSLGRQNSLFHLDFEQNLPTYYQSLKLISFGLFFFILAFSKSIQLSIKSFLLPVSLFLFFLGIDELFQIHENIYKIFEFIDVFHPSKIVELSMKMGYRSSLWILYYLPFIFIFIFWSGYWLHHFQSKMKSNAKILLLSTLSLFTILMTEILSSTGSFSESNYFWLVTIEETAEMLLASTLIFIGMKVLHRHI